MNRERGRADLLRRKFIAPLLESARDRMKEAISRRALIGLALAAIPTVALAKLPEAWATYSNGRFGTSIQYPRRFRPSAPSRNSDGLTFAAPDGAELRVWGAFNVHEFEQDDLERYQREHHGPGENIFEAERGDRWFAFIGRRGPTAFFYRRYLMSHGNKVINAFEVTYRQDLRAEYELIVARIAKSFRPGRAPALQENR